MTFCRFYVSTFPELYACCRTINASYTLIASRVHYILNSIAKENVRLSRTFLFISTTPGGHSSRFPNMMHHSSSPISLEVLCADIGFDVFYGVLCGDYKSRIICS